MCLGDWDLLLMHHMEHIWTMVMLRICKHTFYAYCREFENWCNLRVLSGKFLQQKSCYPESFCFFLTLASNYPPVKVLPVFLLFSNFNLWQTAVAVIFCNSEGLKTWGRDLVILTKEVARSELAIKVTILVKVKSYNKIRETIQYISFYCIVCLISLLYE